MAEKKINGSVTVGTASTLISTMKKTRRLFSLSNISDQVIFLGIGAPAVLNKGIPIAPNGDIIFNRQDEVDDDIYGICQSGSKILCIFEHYTDE